MFALGHVVVTGESRPLGPVLGLLKESKVNHFVSSVVTEKLASLIHRW